MCQRKKKERTQSPGAQTLGTILGDKEYQIELEDHRADAEDKERHSKGQAVDDVEQAVLVT